MYVIVPHAVSASITVIITSYYLVTLKLLFYGCGAFQDDRDLVSLLTTEFSGCPGLTQTQPYGAPVFADAPCVCVVDTLLTNVC